MKARLKKLAEKVPGYNKLIVPLHRFRAIRAANKYDYPASGMKVIAVTGTNGKTTTCFMIDSILRAAGYKVGLMTTVAYGFDGAHKSQTMHMTTESAPILNKRIAELRDAGAEYLVMETSSHALAQHRTFGIPVDIAVMTNVTHEHLDYHRTFANYLNAKRKLFKLANKNHSGKRIGIVNADDPNVERFASDIKHPFLYGIDNGDLLARHVRLEPDGVEYFVKFAGEKLHIKTQIPGRFNVYNSLAATAVGLSYDIAPDIIERGISELSGVEGRMNRIDEGQDFEVIVDFAHTPDSFEKLLSDLRASTKGKLIVMFGSAGRRDESKRAVQGEIAGKYADEVVITEEDDRDVNGEEIMNQIADGAIVAGKVMDTNLFKVHDRVEAIEFALRRAGSKDVVLLLGKGHEKTIARAHGEDPWDETATAREALRKISDKVGPRKTRKSSSK